MSFSLLGIGSPLLDIQVRTTDEFLLNHVPGEKGGMEPVSTEEIDRIVSSSSVEPEIFPGGAAGNTIFALNSFQVKSALRGKLGRDKYMERYFDFSSQRDVSTHQLIVCNEGATGCCLALVTEDAERTMRSCLGVSLELTEQDIETSAFSEYDAVLVEGFMAYSGKLEHMVRCAKKHGKFVILDLASFEIADKFRALFIGIASDVDMVVANEFEAAAFTGSNDPVESLNKLKEYFSTAVVKCGSDGVWFSGNSDAFFVPAHPVEQVIDTTAAGDLWLAGYIYGKDKGASDEIAVKCGTMFSAKIISHTGSILTEKDIEELKFSLKEII